MTVKSIIEVEIDKDGTFKKFKESFEEYRKMLNEMPAAWGAVNEETKNTKNTFDGIAAAMLAQNDMTRRLLLEQRDVNQSVERSERAWSGIAKATKAVAADVLSMTSSLLRWSALSGIAGGLIGGGSLFGIDRLANVVGAGRRSAQGLGLRYGEQQSFESNFQRLVDSRSFLGGVNESLTDVSKRVSLYGAGLSESDIQGKDTAQVAAAALSSLKKLVDKTPDQFLGQFQQSRQLGNLGLSVEDLRRLKATSVEEFSSILGNYQKRAGQFDLSDPTQRAYQDLGVQFENAWLKIENSFVKGLTGLAGPLTHLSEGVSEAVAAFLGNKSLAKVVDEFGEGIEWVSRKLANEDFKSDVETFFSSLKALGKGIWDFVKWFAPAGQDGSDRSLDAPTLDEESRDPRSFWERRVTKPLSKMGPKELEKTLGIPLNNPTNIKDYSTGAFAAFTSPEDALRKTAWQIQYDETKHGLTNLQDLIGDEHHGYAPSSDHNDVDAYVKFLTKETGIGATETLDPNNKAQLAAIVSAIAKKETGSSYSPKVIVQIFNNTGGNAVTSTSQLPQ